MNVVDIIDREINVGDYVVFTNNIYEVLDVARQRGDTRHGYVRIFLVNPSPTTKPCNKYSREMCLIPKEEYLLYLLKKK